jgi:hypothetical protein
VIRYERVEDRRLVFTIPDVDRGDVALVGFHPSAPGARVFRW